MTVDNLVKTMLGAGVSAVLMLQGFELKAIYEHTGGLSALTAGVAALVEAIRKHDEYVDHEIAKAFSVDDQLSKEVEELKEANARREGEDQLLAPRRAPAGN